MDNFPRASHQSHLTYIRDEVSRVAAEIGTPTAEESRAQVFKMLEDINAKLDHTAAQPDHEFDEQERFLHDNAQMALSDAGIICQDLNQGNFQEKIAKLQGFLLHVLSIAKEYGIAFQISSTIGKWRRNEEIKLKLLESENETANAKIKIALNELLAGFSKDLSDSKVASAAQFDAFDGVIKRYKSKEPDLEKILGNANKAALAVGFKMRAEELARTKFFWGLVLGLVLLLMYCTGQQFFESLKDGARWEHLLARGLLVAPVIWGGWFSAKQYGFTSRLQEDYEFKVAAATSYESYKLEATTSGDPMLQKLIELTIENFGESPLRIYNLPTDPGTPAQEILESLAKTSNLAEAIAKFRTPKAD